MANSYEFDWVGLFTPPIWTVFLLTQFLQMLQHPKLDKFVRLPALVVQLFLAITFNNMVLQAFFTVKVPPFQNHAEANMYLERNSQAKLYYGFDYEILEATYSKASLDKMIPFELDMIEDGEAATLLTTQTKSIGFAAIPTLAYLYNQSPEQLTFFADELPMTYDLSYSNPNFPFKHNLTLAYLALNEGGWTYVREGRVVKEVRRKRSKKAPFSLQLEHFRSIWQSWLLLFIVSVVLLLAEFCVYHTYLL